MIKDIWQSFLAMPVWVQIWVTFVLVPVNMASILFLGEPYGVLVALLAIGGMTPNVAIIVVERGFSKAMAFPHLAIWAPLVLFLIWWLAQGGPANSGFATYVKILLVVDLISLAFDFPDARAWLKGNRAVSRS